MRQFIWTRLLLPASIFFISNVYAASPANPWYLSLNGGIFQGNFDMKYGDLSDLVANTFRQPVQQYGYSGGIGIGYTRTCGQYLLGGELSGNFYTGNANFASGSSTSAFTDQLSIDRNIDLIFVPGVFINETTAVYAKAGLAYEQVASKLLSPIDTDPTYIHHSDTANVFGLALGLGVKRQLSSRMDIFAEYLYHDYEKIKFPNFQNFTANYNHIARLTTQNVAVGIHYYF